MSRSKVKVTMSKKPDMRPQVTVNIGGQGSRGSRSNVILVKIKGHVSQGQPKGQGQKRNNIVYNA